MNSSIANSDPDDFMHLDGVERQCDGALRLPLRDASIYLTQGSGDDATLRAVDVYRGMIGAPSQLIWISFRERVSMFRYLPARSAGALLKMRPKK